jgi:hypothetical protein
MQGVIADEIYTSFTIHRVSILNREGTAEPTFMPSLSDGDIGQMYEFMVLAPSIRERVAVLLHYDPHTQKT